jgi:hypothetical protein
MRLPGPLMTKVLMDADTVTQNKYKDTHNNYSRRITLKGNEK